SSELGLEMIERDWQCSRMCGRIVLHEHMQLLKFLSMVPLELPKTKLLKAIPGSVNTSIAPFLAPALRGVKTHSKITVVAQSFFCILITPMTALRIFSREEKPVTRFKLFRRLINQTCREQTTKRFTRHRTSSLKWHLRRSNIFSLSHAIRTSTAKMRIRENGATMVHSLSFVPTTVLLLTSPSLIIF
ncbi:transmembrane protein, putative, partial [Bodo saltans]